MYRRYSRLQRLSNPLIIPTFFESRAAEVLQTVLGRASVERSRNSTMQLRLVCTIRITKKRTSSQCKNWSSAQDSNTTGYGMKIQQLPAECNPLQNPDLTHRFISTCIFTITTTLSPPQSQRKSLTNDTVPPFAVLQ